MTPKQIGALAEHVEKVVKKYKDDTYFSRGNWGEAGDWEKELARLVNEDKRLPDYDVLDNVVLEFLLSHYESEVHSTGGESWGNDNEPVG